MPLKKDMWIPIKDSENEWLNINTDTDRICKTHTEVAGSKPTWGTSGQTQPYKGPVYCCK